jgi:uracil-DNA glycosylase family 4
LEPLMGTGKKNATVMFVVDNPSEFEYKKGKYMVGKAGKLLKGALEQLEIDPDKDCYFTGVVKYSTPENRPPLKEEIQECEEYLEAELDIIKPDIIVPMGNIALKKILGKTGITKFRGKAVEKDDRIIFPILHAEMLFQQPKHSKNWATDLQNLKELVDKGSEFLERADVNYRYLETIEEVEEEVDRMMKSKHIVFDLETTGLNPFVVGAKIVCISLTDKTHYGVTIPLEHKEFTWPAKILEKIKQLLKKLLENKSKKMAHNGKFDMKWLMAKYGIDVHNFAFDPMLVHYLTVSEERGGHGLKELAWEHTDMGGYDNELDEFKATLPEAIRHNYDNIPWKILRTYASADVDCTFRLYKKFRKNLKENKGWNYVFKNIMIPASYMLRDIETNGIKLDEEELSVYEKVFPERIAEIEEKLRQYPEVVQIEREKHKLFELRQKEMKKPKDERDKEILKYNKYKNFKFNFGSTAQLRELLFEKLGLETPFLTDKGEERKRQNQKKKTDFVPEVGEMSTGKETLAYLDGKHDISSLLSEWRRLDKVFGTYIKPARNWIGEDKLVHPTFMLHGTVTGRLASEAPNAQNFPRKSNDPRAFEYQYGIKKLFKSRFGDEGLILQADYSQLELRIAAIFSGDERLIQAYKDGHDLHKYAASISMKKPIEDITDDDRTKAKAVNFGLIYGKGSYSLANDMGVSVEEAEEFIKAYFKEFAGVKKWLDATRKKVIKDKYVTTLTGRWRRLPGVESNNRGVQGDCFRQAVNAPIQSSGSDITVMSLILMNYKLKEAGLKSCICITVHDSIVLDVYIPELKEVYNIVKDTMENPPFDWITVPIVADMEIGRDYGALVGLDSLEDLEGYDTVFDYIDEKVAKKKEKDWANVNK